MAKAALNAVSMVYSIGIVLRYNVVIVVFNGNI